MILHFLSNFNEIYRDENFTIAWDFYWTRPSPTNEASSTKVFITGENVFFVRVVPAVNTRCERSKPWEMCWLPGQQMHFNNEKHSLTPKGQKQSP